MNGYLLYDTLDKDFCDTDGWLGPDALDECKPYKRRDDPRLKRTYAHYVIVTVEEARALSIARNL